MKQESGGAMKRVVKFIALMCLTVAVAGAMLMPVTADAAAKAVKVKVTTKRVQNEQMTVRGLTKSNKVVWKYTTKKYPAVELSRTKCKVHGSRVYIFEGTSLRVVKKSTGRKISVTEIQVNGGHVVGFDSSKNVYVTGYYATKLYKISPKGDVLWMTDYQSTGKYWAHKITVTDSAVTLLCEASDSNPGTSGNYKAVFSPDTGAVI